MSFNFRFATALLVGLVLTSTQARAADIILGNLPQTNDDTTTTISTSSFKAAAFTMGAVAYTLDEVVLRLGGFASIDVPVIQIRDDTGGSAPGNTVLASFTNPAAQGSGVFDYTFTPSAPFTLSASTKYWLYVASSANSYVWLASLPSITPTGVATFNSFQRSSDGGSSFTASTAFNSFQITGTVVPEPSTVILSGLSVAAIAANAFHRRRKA